VGTYPESQRAVPQAQSISSTSPGAGCSVLHTQRALENQAVRHPLQADAESREPGSNLTSTGFTHDFSRIPVHATPAVTASESPALGMTSGEASSSATAAPLTTGHAVNGKLTYNASITRGGPAPPPPFFGLTQSNPNLTKDWSITRKSGTFEVSAALKHSITYQVRPGTGPSNQTDIASATDSDIKKTNYPVVVSDLTPNASGRPPRTKFWAEDLTVEHELVHANDFKQNGPAALAKATTWLNGQTAANVEKVKTLLDPLIDHFASALRAAQSNEDREKHAYREGAPSYKTRADAIKAKGNKGEYK
jgi:hypothetical protein